MLDVPTCASSQWRFCPFEQVQERFRRMPSVGRTELRLGVRRADDLHAPIVGLTCLRFPRERVVPVAQLTLVLPGVVGARPGQVWVVVALDDFLVRSLVTLIRPPAESGVAVGHLRDGVRVVTSRFSCP